MRLDKNGKPAGDAEELVGVIQAHFAEVEAAELLSPEQLRHRHAMHLAAPVAAQPDILNVATLSEVTALFASAKTRKAAGIDALPDDVYKAAPQALARICHPLLAKKALLSREALVLKSGMARDIYNGRGSPKEMASYRSVLLECPIAKHHHRFMRSRLLTCMGALVRCIAVRRCCRTRHRHREPLGQDIPERCPLQEPLPSRPVCGPEVRVPRGGA